MNREVGLVPAALVLGLFLLAIALWADFISNGGIQ